MPGLGNSGMESLIPIVNKLHDVFTQMGTDDGQIQIDLPQIAVVGGQSAGKSSVLENFVGRDFLPRGTGIVTRRPLILQLINFPEEWGEFLHKKGTKFHDFDSIRTEIEEDTDRVTGLNKGISKLPINLRIYSPHVLNITLIDLPGLTRNPIGDQPEDIESQIRDMIMDYISKPTCLILAVTPANIDLGTSDAIKLAKLADPGGLRTIGVITKLDLMDAGTDAGEILKNKFLPLKRGYVGVVNRSQKDIDGRKNIKDAQEAEKKFFRTHPAYKSMVDKMGTQYLQKLLNEQLTAHIRECLPALRTKLRKQEIELGKDVEKHHLNDSSFKTKALHQMIHQLQCDFREIIRGYGTVDTAELSAGVKLNYIFHEMFSAELSRLTVDEDEFRREISLAVRNSHGIEMGIFTPNIAFQTVVKRQIRRLKDPSLKCVELVTKEFSRTILGCVEMMKLYPKLCEEIEFIISSQIQDKSETCKDFVTNLLESEEAYINSKHEEFIGSVSKTQSQEKSGLKKSKAGAESASHVMIKGYLYILNPAGLIKGSPKTFWFVLSSDTLVWYKDEHELAADKKCELPLVGLHMRLRREDSRRSTFTLFNPDGKSLNKEFKQLVLSCEDDAGDSWRDCFHRAGVFPSNSLEIFQDPGAGLDGSRSTIPTNGLSTIDTQLEQQVETIRLLVDSYMKIVTRTTKDLVPKIIMNFIVKKTQDFIDRELLAQIHSQNLESLMAESREEQLKREMIFRAYQACKESLKIIDEVSQATSSSTTKLAPTTTTLLAPSRVENGKHASSGITNGGFQKEASSSMTTTGSTLVRESLLTPVVPRRPMLKAQDAGSTSS